MYSSLLTEDTYKRADAIYRSISEDLSQSLKEFVACAKVHDKNTVEHGKSFRSCYSTVMKIGIAGTSSPGCKDVGKCIMEITEAMQEVDLARDVWLQKFRNDVLFPIERKTEQDMKYLIGLRKKSQDEFKARSNENEKALAKLARVKKQSFNKPDSKKRDRKIKKATERLLAARTASAMHAHEMLNRAFSEERKRYCLFVEHRCELVKASIDMHRKSIEVLEENLDQWIAIGESNCELLPAAVALIESSLPQIGNATLDELDMKVGTDYDNHNSSEDGQHDAQKTSSPNKIPSNVSLKRNSSKSFAKTRKRSDMYNPYCLSDDDAQGKQFWEEEEDEPIKTYCPTDGEARHRKCQTQESHREKLFVPRERMKSLRKSDSSGISESSRTSSDAPDQKVEPENLLNKATMCVGDIWNLNADQKSKMPRAKEFWKTHVEQLDPSSSDIYSSIKDGGNYTDVSDDSHERSKILEKVHYKALYDYNPGTSGDRLSLLSGDRIVVYSREDKRGWGYGINKRTEQKGWFPLAYSEMEKNLPKEPLSPANLNPQDVTLSHTSAAKFDPSKVGGVAIAFPDNGKPALRKHGNRILDHRFKQS